MLISSHLNKILELVSNNQTTLIVAPTGSGKSVAVPAFLAGSGYRTLVTVPTRTAALSLAEYQRAIKRAQDPTVNANTYVGFAAEGNVQYNDSTMIMYVTGGHARRKLLTYFEKGTIKPIDFCDVLFVDEIHTGSIDTTIIISLWMKAAKAQVRVPRLIIASATPIPLSIDPTPVEYRVEAKSYPIEYNYIQKDLTTDDGSLYYETAIKTVNIHTTSKITDGHILVFAPGATEVETISNQIFQLLENDKTVDIIPAFSALTQAEIELIYQQKEGIRKIIIATNIAEMSITIENIGFVVDTMLEKRSETSLSGGFRLTTHYISKDSAKQRSGRTGRTRSGISYRMCTLEKYNSFEEHRPMEIDRVPIFELVMELLDIGLDPEEIITGTSKQRIQDSTKLLKRLELIKIVDGTVNVTDLGHFAPQFQFSVKNATFLWKWIEAGHPVFPGIVVASLIDSYGPSYFWQPRKKPDMSIDVYNNMIVEHRQKYFSRFIGYNDLETSLNMWKDLTSFLKGIVGDQRQIAQWAKENSMNNKKIKELLLIVNQTIGKLKNSIDIKIGPFTTAGVMKAARPILKLIYSDQLLINKRGVNYMNTLTKEEYKLDSRDALNMFVDKPPYGIVGLITAEIKTQKDSIFRLVSFGIDFEKEEGDVVKYEEKKEKKTISRAPIITTGDKNLPKIPHWSELPPKNPEDNPYNFGYVEEHEGKKEKKKVHKLSEKTAKEIDDVLELLEKIMGSFDKDVLDVLEKGYPLMSYYYKEEDIKSGFEKLKNYKVSIYSRPYLLKNVPSLKSENIKYKGNYVIIKDLPNEYPDIEVISDYFGEECRVKARFMDNESSYDYFRNNSSAIIKQLQKDNIPITVHNLHESLWEKSKDGNINPPMQCSMFKPKLIKYFIELFGAHSVLDISSGWGDRLIGAIAADVDVYHGFDPNPAVHATYKKIIDFFKPRGEYKILELPFEDAILKEEYYDLVMSSPPYFDMEVYSDDDNQSYKKGMSEREWYDRFLKRWINQCKKALKKNGILALNIYQTPKHHYVDWFVKDILQNPDWDYQGVISHTNEKKFNPQPTFIVRKK